MAARVDTSVAVASVAGTATASGKASLGRSGWRISVGESWKTIKERADMGTDQRGCGRGLVGMRGCWARLVCVVWAVPRARCGRRVTR